ncbi:histidyl-tRNA synthetase [Cryptosporidium ubiquitum]|uniref:Histidine--tRNA ligase, cytoplasmic n=1 Tax=Cryptosporidium ubiquitum TaxID=857276 RepID=A0A1J4MIH8_9CRYT|nr:histidyl-tRNA synthetase [Cryptosporidium ubiquitum]OII73831.1 histidyl-tRNA synthetase [Cryptosporidium ubiquitum]
MAQNGATSLFIGTGGISLENVALISTSDKSEFLLEPKLRENEEDLKILEESDCWTGCVEEVTQKAEELSLSEVRALMLTKAVGMAMEGNGTSKKIMIWLLEQLRNRNLNSVKVKYFSTDELTLTNLLQEYVRLSGLKVSKSDAKAFTKGFSVKVSQLALYLGISSTLKSFGECTLAILVEAMSFPLCFLTHLSSISTGGLAETTRNIRWLLEDSKIQREIRWKNKDLGVRLSEIICSLGTLQNSIENLTKCIKGFFLKSGNITTSTKGIEHSIDYIEIMPILEPLKTVISSLYYMERSSLEFLDLLLRDTSKEEIISVNDFSKFDLNSEISIHGLNIEQILKSVTPLTMENLGYINLKINELINNSLDLSKVLRVSTMDGFKDLIHGLKELINHNLEIFSILCILSLQKLADKNYQQYISSIEKAKKKGKNEVSIASHESKNIHEFRQLMISVITESNLLKKTKNDVENGIYSQVLELFQDGQIFRLDSKLKSITTPQNQSIRRPKIPKGTQDVAPQKMAIKNLVFGVIRQVYRAHGAVEIDTPVFELKDTLLGKYGEDSKLIYDLKDQGGEQLSLRYDLTVPLARYIATSGLDHLKRYQIGKVYRRDEPQMARGRFREFYQCDLDIVGHYDSMVADSEIIKIATQVLSSFSNWIGQFIIKVNHRQLLDGILEISGVPSEKFKTACSSIDKLDKEPWDSVRNEMINIKGISESCVDKIGSIIQLKGNPFNVIEQIKSNKEMMSNENIIKAIDDLQTLFKYTENCSNCLNYLSFDLSLARGLDYYTGVIYEAVLISNDLNVGSIAAGGRYDQLIGMFSQKSIPAVGFSVGVERIMSIIERKFESSNTINYSSKGSFTDILICNVGDSLFEYRFKIASLLWDKNIPCEISLTGNGKLRKQLDYASNNRIPYCIIVGESEALKNTVQFKFIHNNQTESNSTSSSVSSQEVHLNDLVSHIQSVISEFGSTYSKFSSEFEL